MNHILFTGANGFLGKNILPLLGEKYKVSTLDLSEADIVADISKEIPNLDAFDIVLHAAGKAHSVPKTEAEKQAFFDVNYQGAINLCSGLERSGLPHSFVFLSTVAVYGCETGENITEEHPLNGVTPYALSKIKAESFLIEWAKKNNVVLTILRPSLIAGKNPPGNLGAMINGIKKGKYLSVAGGKARKSVLMATDIVTLVSKSVSRGGVFNVCDNHNPSFRELEQIVSMQSGAKMPKSIPYFLAKSIALAGDLIGEKAPLNSKRLNKITNSLTFCNKKAKEQLDWEPLDVLSNFKI